MRSAVGSVLLASGFLLWVAPFGEAAAQARAPERPAPRGAPEPERPQDPERTRRESASPQLPGDAPRDGVTTAPTIRRSVVFGALRTLRRSPSVVVVEPSDRGERLTLEATDGTAIFVEGRLGSFEDLREGQQVRAAFDEREGRRVLRWIEVQAGARMETPREEATGESIGPPQPRHVPPQGGALPTPGGRGGARPIRQGVGADEGRDTAGERDRAR